MSLPRSVEVDRVDLESLLNACHTAVALLEDGELATDRETINGWLPGMREALAKTEASICRIETLTRVARMEQTQRELVDALTSYRDAFARIQPTNGYREGQGDLWIAPTMLVADDKAAKALALVGEPRGPSLEQLRSPVPAAGGRER